MGCRGTVLVSTCKVYLCAWFSLCVKVCCDKQVSRGQVYVQSCVMPSESYPTLCLLNLVSNGSPMYSVHKLQPASNEQDAEIFDSIV